MTPIRGVLSASLLCLAPWLALAQPLDALPEPLTLEYALSLADELHPEVLAVQADQARALAEREGVSASQAISADIEGRLRWVMPPAFLDEGRADDHRLGLVLRKPLHDFGRSEAARGAAEWAMRGGDYRHQLVLDTRRLRIMEAFFNVLLADMAYDRDMEGLAVAFIQLDRMRNRQELGQASDIVILELERNFEQARHQLSLSNNEQRATRARLANLLNRPGMLPSTLARPVLKHSDRQLPDLDSLFDVAAQNNPEILALQAQVVAMQQRVAAARAGAMPRLDGELEASHYTREQRSNDRWRAGVYLTVPIYSGGRVDAAVASERAGLYEAQAELEQARFALRQQLLDTVLQLQSLRLQYEQAMSEQRYRDLYLDRSRAIYEMEVRSDLGDAMVRLSEAQLALAQANYRLALTWEQLDLLLGKTSEAAALTASAGE